MSMLVLGGSFAEDDPQKLRVHGSGACRFDLTITRVDAGAPGRNTWSAGAVVLDSDALLFDGTHLECMKRFLHCVALLMKSFTNEQLRN